LVLGTRRCPETAGCPLESRRLLKVKKEIEDENYEEEGSEEEAQDRHLIHCLINLD
jgi:hypothetical protein